MLKRDAVSPSLNEVEALAAKATRGAGAGWGTAEDVARAVRWMARHGFDWTAPLLHLLGHGAVASTLAPVFEIGDRLPGMRAGDHRTLDGVSPVWILAILSGAAYGRALRVDVVGPGWRVRLGPDGGISASAPPIDALPSGTVTIEVHADASTLPHIAAVTLRRRAISDSVWRDLEAYAARTYVQPSLHSRLTGAGGGRVDDL